MIEHDTGQPQTTATSPRRIRKLLNVAIATAVLIIAVGVLLLVKLPGSPPPVDYHVAVTGNIDASWVSDNGEGKLDLANGGNSEKIRAGSLTLTVQSTMPSGASCSIVDSNGDLVDTQIAFPIRGTTDQDALTTVTCRTKKH